ncbi:uncharacterized protein LOC141917216 [Strix aluco]|uniref:uncharacterized protein LOC141917216 n=1 Tax=Strix aluco TaxID=111821 RepID=UPI003DA5CB33
MTTQDTCSSPGDLPAPELVLNTFGAREGERVLFQCSIGLQSPATRIFFCKDGVEKYSLKALQGKLSHSLVLNVTLGNAGTYECGYQHRNERNWVRSSALSAPQHLAVRGSGSSSQAGPSTTDPSSSGIVLGVVTGSLLLLAAVSYCVVKKAACRERCQRQQQLPSQEPEVTNYTEIQYSTIAHVGCNRPRVQETNITTAYAMVNHARSQPR